MRPEPPDFLDSPWRRHEISVGRYRSLSPATGSFSRWICAQPSSWMYGSEARPRRTAASSALHDVGAGFAVPGSGRELPPASARQKRTAVALGQRSGEGRSRRMAQQHEEEERGSTPGHMNIQPPAPHAAGMEPIACCVHGCPTNNLVNPPHSPACFFNRTT